ncbi:nucleoside diphosphate kinase regulator [Sphingomonas sp. S1-29]|uniref:nucleoside diphosphate kinase regulator n=1 Tax=Sphingomonas sp. S1-29 TaxID=2991074 RepID=UPI00223F8213|nr:nucleoside diphosphate kinase regulator [Sphingomonas sp. S1-29]UZK68804.1 nucleoside diphosphate kinase regulator [Sphingomonas sp. S1-29]
MSTTKSAATRPQIHMIEEEADNLSDLALTMQSRFPQVSELLIRETSRAKLHTAASIPPDVVTMQSFVEFVDEGAGTRRTVQLVFPPDADISAGRISILTPVGAGLIGLREGQSILWPDREGHERKLVIVKVEQRVMRAA